MGGIEYVTGRHYLDDIRIIYRAPVDTKNDVVLDDTAGASSSLRVFDRDKDGVATAAAIASATVVFCDNAGDFAVADPVQVHQADGSLHVTTIVSINAASKSITLTLALTQAVRVGDRVRCLLQGPETMAEFGAPHIDSKRWGYDFTCLGSLVWRQLGKVVEFEVSFSGSGAGGLDETGILCMTLGNECADG